MPSSGWPDSTDCWKLHANIPQSPYRLFLLTTVIIINIMFQEWVLGCIGFVTSSSHVFQEAKAWRVVLFISEEVLHKFCLHLFFLRPIFRQLHSSEPLNAYLLCIHPGKLECGDKSEGTTQKMKIPNCLFLSRDNYLMNDDDDKSRVNVKSQQIHHHTEKGSYDALILQFFSRDIEWTCVHREQRGNLIAIAESMFQLIRC